MARGSIIWRCPICGDHHDVRCKHPGGQYHVSYYTQVWDPARGRVVKKRRKEVVGPRKKDAEDRLTDRLKSLKDKTYREPKDTTFADFADKW